MDFSGINWEEQIYYKDMHVAVVYKPFGMLSQKDKKGEDGLSELLFQYLGKPNFWQLVQRIDRMAGGLMTLATSKRAGKAFAEFTQEKKLGKTYYVVVEGVLENSQAELKNYIGRDRRQKNIWRAYDEKRENTRPAILEYRVLAEAEGKSLLKVKPITGRTHQIRVQMARIGHPVVGDKKYGKTSRTKNNLLCLFSAEVSFPHPIKGDFVDVKAPLPYYQQYWELFAETGPQIQSVAESDD